MLALSVRGRRRQLGLSLVELMVGITVGLIIVAAASLMLSTQLVENRRLIAETQLQQDLRAAADIITRELRRSGALAEDPQLSLRVWTPNSAVDAWPNSLAQTLSPAASSAGATEVRYDYGPGGAGTSGPTGGFGYRLDTARGVIEANLVAGGWQDLTDPGSIQVTNFIIDRPADTTIRIPCPKACPPPANDSSCWPTVSVRAVEVLITARSRALPDVQRTHTSRVRLRNDYFRFFQAPTPVSGFACPP